jgi:hypothetical protein
MLTPDTEPSMRIERRRSPRASSDAPGRLIYECRVRVLNCSVAGCLLETTRPAAVNSVAMLHVSFGGKIFEDAVEVVRCGVISVGANIHHIAARFLSVAPPYAGSLRYLMRTEISELAGWLDRRVEK